MKIMLDNGSTSSFNTAVALGNFDGLHLGHQHLIGEMKKKAKEKSLIPSVFTFNNDTLVRFKTNKTNNILTSNEQKKFLLEQIGIDLLYIVDFSDDIMHMSPYEFIKNIIIEKLKSKLVVVGFDFRFGYKALGDSEFLKKVGKELGFEVLIIEPIAKDYKVISSSYIRELIGEGLIKEANILLGRPFIMSGTVVKGKGRGKGLGFATANLQLDTDYQIPKFGVYKTYTFIDEVRYLSVTSIGKNPTFNDVGFSLETHIIDFDKDIYGQKIQVSIEDYLREEKKFSKREDLIAQVMDDIQKVIRNK